MEFNEMLCAAQMGDQGAVEQLFMIYRPLIIRQSMTEGRFHEDLYQELSLVFLHCISKFRVDW